MKGGRERGVEKLSFRPLLDSYAMREEDKTLSTVWKKNSENRDKWWECDRSLKNWTFTRWRYQADFLCWWGFISIRISAASQWGKGWDENEDRMKVRVGWGGWEWRIAICFTHFTTQEQGMMGGTWHNTLPGHAFVCVCLKKKVCVPHSLSQVSLSYEIWTFIF